MGCGKRMTQMVPTQYHYKEVPAKCGQTSIHGSQLLCNDCKRRLEQRYPQGWVNTPGDLCKHGNYVGDAGGPDYICDLCEDGE
jgi:hypothetical protein